MQNVALYARSAQTKQSGKSQTAEQLKALRQHAKKNNYKVVAEYADEGQGGDKLLRPALTKLREDMKKGKFKIVIANSLDRLSRNVSDYWILKDLFKQHGIGIEYVNPPQDNSAAESFNKLMMEASERYYQSRLAEEIRKGILKRSEQKAKTPAVKQEVFSDEVSV